MTIILSIEYDGTNYAGWQIQRHSNTVQKHINNAVSQLLLQDLFVTGAGRTDAGVHAKSQIAHFVCKSLKNIKHYKLKSAINSFLPKDIRINDLWITMENFHSRYDAIAREYKYRFSLEKSVFTRFFVAYLPYKIDENLLFDVEKLFLGKNDFTTFSKLNKSTKNYICDVETCKWTQLDPVNFELTIKADRFVYGMVRSLVGTMFDVARGKRSIEEVQESFLKKDRNYNSPLAPACGLVLNNIFYPKSFTFLSNN